MIETEYTTAIGTGIDRVWDYAQDIQRWAELMPGYQECTVIDAHESRWLLKVGAGGMVRTVRVRVHVDEWAGPGRVDFSFRLEGDPCEGGGQFLAAIAGDGTEVTLRVRVAGSGPMAPMWEAMSRPLLPQLAKSFAGSLKREIETAAGIAVAPRPGIFARIAGWLRRVWRAMFGTRAGNAGQ